MNTDIQRDFGEQPIAQIMVSHDLKAKDLVVNSTEKLTHKMVARACKGRKLTSNTKCKIRNALNHTTGKTYSLKEL
ncbi:MAG: hypothetical protein KAG97_06990, partial [Victivallales bacterium]|nr:hypothetical protein [Victivallales bacterium]